MKALIAAACVLAATSTYASADQIIDPPPTLDNPTAKLERMAARCDEWIKDNKLETSPVTYRRIAVENVRDRDGQEFIWITYDAQNIYGAIVRKRAVCGFDDTGHLDKGTQ